MEKKIRGFLEQNDLRFISESEIKEFVTMGVGGRVAFIIFAERTRDLEALLKFLLINKQKYILIGGGSNVIFPDSGARLIVIINRTAEISMYKDGVIRADSGVKNADFIDYCRKNGIGGFEFLAGIPGTLGGAAAVNAGAFGESISDKILGGDIFNKDGIIERITTDFFNFEYRNSRFKYGKDVIITLHLSYRKGDKSEIKEKVRDILRSRAEKHPPYSSLSAGCFFKNPVIKGEKISAGKLIEACSFKGKSVNDALISEKHSNFMLNKGSARMKDVRELEKKIRTAVLKKTGIVLEREVIFISPAGKKY